MTWSQLQANVRLHSLSNQQTHASADLYLYLYNESWIKPKHLIGPRRMFISRRWILIEPSKSEHCT
jgi:hypothetical protein